MWKKIVSWFKQVLGNQKNNYDLKELREKCVGIHHVALLIDGHRRWARKQGLDIEIGYRKILEVLPPILEFGWQLGIHTITVWVLTSSNVIKRPKDQLEIIYKVYDELLDVLLSLARQTNTRIIHIGRKDRIPQALANKLSMVEDATKEFNEQVLNLALDYGGRDEILFAVKNVIKAGLKPEEINDAVFGKFMYTSGQKYSDPDLIIRPGNVLRMSGFMCWNTGFSELYFSKKYFPDFTKEDLADAIIHFNQKDRRFGA